MRHSPGCRSRPPPSAHRREVLTGDGPAIDDSLLDRLRAAFAEHAELPALRWQGEEWSYAELDRRTDRLAGGLQAAGIAPGDFVLLLLDRDPLQIVARLALIKAGAIEIPIDPAAPDERVLGILADSGARLVLASDPGARAWPEGVRAATPGELDGEHTPVEGLGPDSPLIMIYTSGTTGAPKGTLVPHGGILSTCAANGYTDYRPGQRIMHLGQYTFDASLLDVHTALLAGATIVMASREQTIDMDLLRDFLVEERIDAGLMITAVFHLLMAEHPEAIAGMSAIYVGGEALQAWAAARAYEVLGPGRIHNLYGPTEVSIVTTHYRLDEAPGDERMPIGGPGANRELFIMTADGVEAPRGVPGELCVSGPGLALGYHRRDDLTADRFPHELGEVRQRVYRTGDRVVLDDADRIVYLDRIDNQVKHAGYRIELAEIEVVMNGVPGVRSAVAIHTDEGGNSRLTGFYTGERLDDAALRGALGARLPRYAVPQGLVHLDELPLTGHGKVDR